MADSDEEVVVDPRVKLMWAGFGWVAKNWPLGASVEITDPPDRGEPIDHQPWIKLKGASKNSEGRKFWILTHNGDNYWPQKPITFDHDGRWSCSANVNTKAETRQQSIVLAQVSDFADSIFRDWKRTGVVRNWQALEFRPDGKAVKIVQEIVVTVLGTNRGAKSN